MKLSKGEAATLITAMSAHIDNISRPTDLFEAKNLVELFNLIDKLNLFIRTHYYKSEGEVTNDSPG